MDTNADVLHESVERMEAEIAAIGRWEENMFALSFQNDQEHAEPSERFPKTDQSPTSTSETPERKFSPIESNDVVQPSEYEREQGTDMSVSGAVPDEVKHVEAAELSEDGKTMYQACMDEQLVRGGLDGFEKVVGDTERGTSLQTCHVQLQPQGKKDRTITRRNDQARCGRREPGRGSSLIVFEDRRSFNRRLRRAAISPRRPVPKRIFADISNTHVADARRDDEQ